MDQQATFCAQIAQIPQMDQQALFSHGLHELHGYHKMDQQATYCAQISQISQMDQQATSDVFLIRSLCDW